MFGYIFEADTKEPAIIELTVWGITTLKTQLLKKKQIKERKTVYREKKRVKILRLLPLSTTKKKKLWSVAYVTFKCLHTPKQSNLIEFLSVKFSLIPT